MAAEGRQVKPITPSRDRRKKISRSCRSAMVSLVLMGSEMRRTRRGVGTMQILLMIYQITVCRDWLRCALYRLRTDIPNDFLRRLMESSG
jgi:hypothetical protein